VREIDVGIITERVKELCMEANFDLGGDVLDALERAKAEEESPTGIEILGQLEENASIARQERVAICQDTGVAVVFVELGQDVHLVGGDLNRAIDEGVRQGYGEGYLRKSLCHPFTRANTGDNTPAVVHVEVVPGDRVKLIVAPKGGGSENMSRVTMLSSLPRWESRGLWIT
jgi:fumarate hydratase subunit alpha